jgi:predicted RNA methylase
MMTLHNRSIAATLRRRARVSDSSFDCIYPELIQRASGRYWTPVNVALTAARWLTDMHCRNVFDVGAGPGKFCIVAKLAAALSVHGIEQRAPLVEAARSVAASYEADVAFEHGTVEAVDPGRFEAFYFYNPFGENYYTGDDRFDDQVELSATRCARDLASVEGWLDRAAVGTCVLTFHGFGGRIPDTYRLVRSLDSDAGVLRLWVKRRACHAQGFLLELGELVMTSAQLEELSIRLGPQSCPQLRELLERTF